MNKTKINKGINEYPHDFEEYWSHYPRKGEKPRAFRQWKTKLKQGATREDLIAAATNYAIHVEGRAAMYIKSGGVFLGPDNPWKDYVDGPPDEGSQDAGFEVVNG